MRDDRRISRGEIAGLIQRFGIVDADAAFVERALELSTALMPYLANLPDSVGKDLEPAHVFSVPLR